MEEKLPKIFKGHEIIPEEINKGEGKWEAFVRRLATDITTDKELVPGGPFHTEEAAHKNAIHFLVQNR